MSKKQIEKIDVIDIDAEFHSRVSKGEFEGSEAQAFAFFDVEIIEKINEIIKHINSQEEEKNKKWGGLKDVDFTKVTNEEG